MKRSLINTMMSNTETHPVVGEGATVCHFTDRNAFEVIRVSNNGMECEIRKMDCVNIGDGYGDERYQYQSNPENYTMVLEWNKKKESWRQVYFTVEIIKSKLKKYTKEYGYHWRTVFANEHGFDSYEDMFHSQTEECPVKRLMLIDGATKKYKNYNDINVMFGVMDEYRDPTF